MSISRIFEIGKRSLLTYQSAINTTSNNIANVNKEGYTRRRINLSEMTSSMGLVGQIGWGVDVDKIVQIKQLMVENQIYHENQNLGKYSADKSLYTQIEAIYADSTGAGLSDVLTDFWNSWNDLANDPESQGIRSVVKEKGKLLANTFNRIHSKFTDMQDQTASEILVQVETINQIISQISKLNEKISVSNSLDLKDERSLLINQLSKYINIDVRQNNDKITISTDGFILVSDGNINLLSTEISTENDFRKINIKINNINHRPDITSGELASLLETHNKTIPDNLQNLNDLAAGLAKHVNDIHSSGYNLDNVTGVNFFNENIVSASDFKLNDAIEQNPALIATRSSLSGEGDGSIAQAIFDLQFNDIINGQTASNFYNSMITDIGNQLKDSSFLYDSQQLIVQQLENQRESISGVSLDEEMTKLMQYEQAYQAATKVVSTVDEMVQTLLLMV